jgi:hypothetical protein
MKKNTKTKDLANVVIEIDEVEYFIDEDSSKLIAKGEKNIVIIRLIDGVAAVFSQKKIKDAIEKNGIADYMD